VLKIQTIHKLNTTQNKQTTQNTAKQSLLMTLGQETRWAYSKMLLSPHGAQPTENSLSRHRAIPFHCTKYCTVPVAHRE